MNAEHIECEKLVEKENKSHEKEEQETSTTLGNGDGDNNQQQEQQQQPEGQLKEDQQDEKPNDNQEDEEEDLEEGELKDDDEDDDDDDDLNEQPIIANNNNGNNNTNDNNNNGGFPHKDSSFVDNNRHHDHHHPHQHHHQLHHQNYPPHHGHGPGAGPMQPQYHQLQYLHYQGRRQMSPSQAAEMHGLGPYPSNHHFVNNSNNHYWYPAGDGGPPGPPHGGPPGPPLPMNHHPQAPPGMYSRGGPGAVGPMQKVNIRCRFYSKTSNKCTWGDHCRFEHRDDSPGPPTGANPAATPASAPPQPQPLSGALSPGGSYPYPSSSSSASAAVVYERKHRLAYELAPWNDSRVGPNPGYPPPPAGKYDRGDPGGPYPPAGPPGRSSFYRNHHYPSRELYGREPPPPHLASGGAYPANYPSAYRGGPMGQHHHHPSHHPNPHHVSHYNKFMSSSQRSVPSDARRSRSNKRGHDEDESSWSDSGSDDSILGRANYGNRNQDSSTGATNKSCKLSTQTNSSNNDDQTASNEPPEEGSGTPPGEPLPEDRERQEMLLNKLKEIEDLIAKKKGEQD